jgi:microcin C transport system substrate-binding protein
MARTVWTTSLAAGMAAMVLTILPVNGARAEEQKWVTAMSLVDTPKHPGDFKHFDWVNPAAPKGGSVTLEDPGGFDTLNFYPTGANVAPGIALIYDQLMISSPDEPSTSYAMLAERVSYPADFSSVTYQLRPAARFSDGKPVTPEDVIWSFDMRRKIDPQSAKYYQNVVSAEKTGDHEITFKFDVKGNRELPFIVGETIVLPKHFWEAKDAAGKPRDLTKAIFEPLVASGPYKIKSVEVGRAITYVRNPDYWAKDLPIAIGQWNLDEIRFVSYQDPSVAFEAFKAGEIEFRAENSAKNWATGYEFPALKAGAVKKELLTLKDPQPMQSFAFNIRRSKFADPRVRRAIGMAFDFELSNKNLFFGQYKRTSSYFENQELASTGLPSGRELEILNTVKDQIPPEVFTTEFKNPVNATEGDFRKNLREAGDLLKAAGWSLKNGVLTNDKSGEALKFEFLLYDELFERITNPFVQNLKRLGIQATIRVIDVPQFIQRVEGHDFDVIVHSFAQSESPGNEQRDFWGSVAADIKGSRNVVGIKNPGIDKLIDTIIFAKDRAELIAASRALDRVLLWNYYVVPQYHTPSERLAYWDKFRRPDKIPSRSYAFPQVWWYDAAAAPKVDAAKRR